MSLVSLYISIVGVEMINGYEPQNVRCTCLTEAVLERCNKVVDHNGFWLNKLGSLVLRNVKSNSSMVARHSRAQHRQRVTALR